MSCLCHLGVKVIPRNSNILLMAMKYFTMNTALMFHPLFVQSCDKWMIYWTCNNTSMNNISYHTELHPTQTVTIVICFSFYHAEFMCANSWHRGLDICLLLTCKDSTKHGYRYVQRICTKNGKMNNASIKAYIGTTVVQDKKCLWTMINEVTSQSTE